MLARVATISRILGKFENLARPPQPLLRRKNRIRTVGGTLAIEGNTLTLEQVTDILDDKRVVGSPREILEVKNAIDAYAAVATYRPSTEKSLLVAHRQVMRNLLSDAGHYRAGNVGIFKGSRVSHIAPKAARVPPLMKQLFAYLASTDETHPWIKAIVFHYELEFIHPFTDGNGRMGRLWQHVLLVHQDPMFEFVPTESIVHRRQAEYYHALETSDGAGHCTPFIEFMLSALEDSVQEFFAVLEPAPQTAESRMALARTHFVNQSFTRKDYLQLFKALSSATASRDLAAAVQGGHLLRNGDKATARYRFVP